MAQPSTSQLVLMPMLIPRLLCHPTREPAPSTIASRRQLVSRVKMEILAENGWKWRMWTKKTDWIHVCLRRILYIGIPKDY